MSALESLRSTAFRWAFTCAGSFALGVLLFAALIYHETVGYLLRQVDGELRANAYSIAHGSLSDQIDDVGEYIAGDPQQFRVAGLFDSSGRPLSGNLRSVPAHLPTDGIAEMRVPSTLLAPPTAAELMARPPGPVRVGRRRRLRLLLEPLGEGRMLVVGVGAGVVNRMEDIVSRALWVTLPPMLALALATGYIVSRGGLRRIAQVHESGRRIIAGQLNERLPTRGTNDAFDQLSQIVNSMLDEIERLLLETKGVGEGIAHDLRTPLTRLRARLERALRAADSQQEPGATLAAGIEDIDQILGTISALLRIAEIEHGARRAEFRSVSLQRIVRDAVELYEPIAEDKRLSIHTTLEAVSTVIGDGDLLFEAVANLLDNAVKFSPAGGTIAVSLRHSGRGPFIQIADGGPGIAPEDWGRATQRFFRKDPGRHTPGNGLGLSLVAAILRLHGFGLTLDVTRAGCCIELECWPQHAEGPGHGSPADRSVESAVGGVGLPTPLRIRAARWPGPLPTSEA